MGKKFEIGVNDLKTLYPLIAAEFHPTKNGDLTPDNVAAKSHKKVWWLCSKGHEWESIVSNRTGQGRGCPYCVGQKVLVGENDLASVNPELAKEWNYARNAGLEPTDVTAGSKKRVWWKCAEGHEWQAIIKSRNYYGTKCPYCPNTRTVIVTKGVNDFASKYPKLAKDWHPTKNGELTPEDVPYASGKKAWWVCKNGHEYQMIISNKAKGRGCPICSRRRRTSFPEQAFYYYIKQIYPDAINSYRDIFEGGMELDIYIPSIQTGIEYDGKIFHNSKTNMLRDAKKYQICKQHGIRLIRIVDVMDKTVLTKSDRQVHIISQSETHLQSAIIDLIYHLGRLSDVDINLKRDRLKILEYLESMDVSLESEFPEIAKEFNQERNGNLKPSFFHPGSNERVWWKCLKCGHEWKAAISDRTGEDKNGCPICAKYIGGEKRRLNIVKQKGGLTETHPQLLESWNYEKNSISPDEVSSGSGKKVWWKCNMGHEWQGQICHATERGLNCPYCANKRILRGFNDLATINPDLALEWHPTKNTDMTPYSIGAGSGKKAWWKCSKCGYEWQAVIVSRNSGTGCPKCSNERKKGNKYAVKRKW